MAERKRASRRDDEEQSQSDELGDVMGNMLEGIIDPLKAEIAALQARVAQLEAQPSASEIVNTMSAGEGTSPMVASLVAALLQPEHRKARQGLWSFAQRIQNNTRGPVTDWLESLGVHRPV